jgi:hypothetical protein
MQQDVDTVKTARPIRIFGVNGIGFESGNAGICQGRTIPWLQDVAEQNVYEDWHVVYRDVIVLNEDNEIIATYNLTDHDLNNSTSYFALREILLDAAR